MGRKLAEELGSGSPSDTLSQWMAHYIAELIGAAHKARAKERGPLEHKVYETILELWSHRAELPNGKRPFEELDPLLRAIESLDPDDSAPRYFRSVRRAIPGDKKDAAAQSLLKFVSDLDASARIMIGLALSEAADATLDESQEWVALAKEAGVNSEPHDLLIRFIVDKTDLSKQPDVREEERNRLQRRIERLDSFISLASKSSAAMKKRMRQFATRGVGVKTKRMTKKPATRGRRLRRKR